MRIAGTNISMVRGDNESITVSLQKDNEVVPLTKATQYISQLNKVLAQKKRYCKRLLLNLNKHN